ncbi:hypothetical protein BVX97_01255 [bacterium E08(2017)]|nr:hypothetical protein BVX97_01255 [bacterium E08(2017)]
MSDFINLLQNARLSLPVFEVVALVVTLSVCLANRWTRGGLVVAYFFAYRWGWMFFAKQATAFFALYLVLGGIGLILAVIDWFNMRSGK